MTEEELVDKIKQNNGKLYIVGGWVRDKLANRESKDKDYVLCGMREELFCRIFPSAQKVGRTFPVYLLPVDDKKCELAFARRESKKGSGYKGFIVKYDENISIDEDLYRRDSTMNSIALQLPEKIIIDPFNGKRDIKNKLIRATSKHFCEDPVRALRAARQAAELEYSIDETTISQMKLCRDDLSDEPAERILNELTRALASNRPSIFFQYLQKADLLMISFPEIAALIGQTQPKLFHPEGDSFIHSMLIVDEVSQHTKDLAVRFAGLCHDLGKGLTPKEMLPHHYGHEITGLDALEKWNERMTLPSRWYKSAAFIIRQHMRAGHLGKPGKIADLLIAIEKNQPGPEGFCQVIKADSKTLPWYLVYWHILLELFHRVDIKKCPANLQGRQIAAWLRDQRINIVKTYRCD